MDKINFKNNKDELIIDILNSKDLKTLFDTIPPEQLQDFIDSDEKRTWLVWYSAIADNYYYFGTFKQLVEKLKEKILARDFELFYNLNTCLLNWFDFYVEVLDSKIEKL